MAEDSNTPEIPVDDALETTGAASEVVADNGVANIGETAQKILTNDDPVAALAETVTALPVPEDTIVILQFFQQMDVASPLARLITAATIVGVSLLLMLIVRIITRRRIAHLEKSARVRPLRWQAQDLVSSEDMKQLWLNVWRWLGWALSGVFLLVGVTGLLMVSNWTLRFAARLITLFVAALDYVWSGFIGYLPNLITIIVIVLVTRYVIRIIGLVFEGIKSRRIGVPGLLHGGGQCYRRYRTDVYAGLCRG